MTGRIPKLIIGLGNPGARYAHTRHNVGFMVVDLLAQSLPAGGWSRDGQALVSRALVDGSEVLLAKPLTYMNRSGDAILPLMAEHSIEPADILLIVDDFNLDFGRIRIRRKGSAGGHNGLDSVIRTLGTSQFPRIRLGIGEEGMPDERMDFVLAEFPKSKDAGLKEMIEAAGDAVWTILRDGISRAMSVFNA